MRSIRHPAELRHQAAAARLRDERVALVPILGGMHDGQAALLRAAGAQCGVVVAVSALPDSAFDGLRVDLVWHPPATQQQLLDVDLGALDAWHVDAVGETMRQQATAIVAAAMATQPDRIFLAVPHAPVAHVVSRLLADLLRDDLSLTLVPPLRDGTGLVASQQLERLDAESRARARLLPATLTRLEAEIAKGTASLARLRIRATAALSQDRAVDLRFVEFVDATSFERLDAHARPGQELLIVAGVSVGGVPLVDVRHVLAPGTSPGNETSSRSLRTASQAAVTRA